MKARATPSVQARALLHQAKQFGQSTLSDPDICEGNVCWRPLSGGKNTSLHAYYSGNVPSPQRQVGQQRGGYEPVNLDILDTSNLMFVFRGTKDVEDLKADAQVFVSGLANSGRYKTDLADVNNNIMRLCTQNKPCTVTLTGHSLGGAIAMEVSRDLQNNPRVNLQGGDLFNSFYQPEDFDNEQLFTKHYIDVDPLHTGKPLGIDLRGAMGGRSGSEFKNRVVYTYPKDIDASKDVRFNQHYMTAFQGQLPNFN